jgi:hypothetical protein
VKRPLCQRLCLLSWNTNHRNISICGFAFAWRITRDMYDACWAFETPAGSPGLVS